MKSFIKYIILFIILDISSQVIVFSLPFFQSQNNEPEFSIEWVSSYSNTDDFKIEKSFIKKVFEFVVGSSEFHLSKPMNVFANDTNSMIILDQGLRNIINYDRTENQLDFFDNDDKLLPSLVGIAPWTDGLFLVTDSENEEIYILDKEKESIKKFNTSIEFNQPTGIAYNPVNKEIIVSETKKHRLLVMDSEGNFIKIIGERGEGRGEFNFPTFITFANGLLYVVDALNYRVQIFNDDYEFMTEFGEQGDGSGYLASPKGIAVDSYGHIYLADALFHVIQVFDIQGNYLYAIGGKGRDNGLFWMPTGVCINNRDQIFIADSYNSRIQVFQLHEVD